MPGTNDVTVRYSLPQGDVLVDRLQRRSHLADAGYTIGDIDTWRGGNQVRVHLPQAGNQEPPRTFDHGRSCGNSRVRRRRDRRDAAVRHDHRLIRQKPPVPHVDDRHVRDRDICLAVGRLSGQCRGRECIGDETQGKDD